VLLGVRNGIKGVRNVFTKVCVYYTVTGREYIKLIPGAIVLERGTGTRVSAEECLIIIICYATSIYNSAKVYDLE
jgi:hypothetical protein